MTRGLLHAEAADDLPGFQKNDYLPGEEFWALVETVTRPRARLRAAHSCR